VSLSFRRKMLLIAATAALAFFLVLIVGALTLQRVESRLAEIEARYIPLLELGPQLDGDLDALQVSLRDAVAAQDRESLGASDALRKKMLARIDASESSMAAADVAKMRGAIETYYRQAYAVSERLIDGEAGEPIIDAMAEMQQARTAAFTEVHRVANVDRTALSGAFESLRTVTREADWVRLVISMISLGLVVALSLWISGSVLSSLAELSAGFARFGEGDFDRPMKVLTGDELGEVAAGGNRMATKLREADQNLRRANDDLRNQQKVLERTNDELVAQTEELDSFSYSVSHDLRSPLRAIDGFSRILSEDHAAQLDAEGLRVLGVIRSNTLKMAQLIDDLLAFSRLGRQKVKISEVDMAALAKAAFSEASAHEPTRRFSFELGALPVAQGDPALLKQVWSNLMANAVKYTRGRAEATIRVSGVVEGDRTIFTVADNGVGFDMKYVDKLFGVFQRLHAAHEFEGTGVGLALVGRII
jgi:signal transduction histidine kinase